MRRNPIQVSLVRHNGGGERPGCLGNLQQDNKP